MDRYRNASKINERPVLVIINFHFTKYNNVAFLRERIMPIFATLYKYDIDVIYTGPKADREFRVVGNHLPTRGWYSYHSIPVILQYVRNISHYMGILFFNDDSCVHPLFLNKYNHATILNEPYGFDDKNWWYWRKANNSNGVNFDIAYYNALSELNITIGNFIIHGFSDFIYIPNRSIPLFLKMEKVMFKHRVFLEYVLPTFAYITGGKNIVNCNHGRMSNIEFCVHMHPTKFSREEDRMICLNRILSKNLTAKPKLEY
jgi:hypothetical protein